MAERSGFGKAKKTRKKSGPPDKGPSKDLEHTLQDIEKQYGLGAIMKLGGEALLAVPGLATGSIGLDLALGGRGLPRGRIVELYGPEASGKTTVALHVIANVQKAGGVAVFVDAEHALDPTWAKRVGVNLEDLLVSQPSCGEESLEITERLVRSNAVDLIVIDSVAALVPRAEIEGEMGDQHVGLQARLMSQAMRKLTGAIAKARTCVVFINQIRMKIGVMFGSPETTTGGRALKFYSSVRIDVRKITTVKDGDRPVGVRVRARVVKNKVAPPFRQAEFEILETCGISRTGEIQDMALEERIIEKSGAWFSYGEIRLGQGREKVRLFLEENPDVAEEITQKIFDSRNAGSGESEVVVDS